MKRIVIFAIFLCLMYPWWGFAESPIMPASGVTVVEADGSPSGRVRGFVFPNGTTSLDAGIMTLSLAAYITNPMTTLGDSIYGGASGVPTRLPGNTTTTKKFASQTGDGVNSAPWSWEVILDGDLPATLTGKTYDGLTLAAQAVGFTIAGGTTSKTLTVGANASVSGTNTGDQDLSGKVDANAAIVGATKTKLTYDAKGLVTAGADATTADINDSADRRYVTDAQLVVIGNTSGTNTGDQPLADTVAALDGTGAAGAASTSSRGDHKHEVTPAGIGAIPASEKAAASGLASLDVSSKVVQDPANASTTSIANGIPKANASGLIESAWLDMVPIGSAYTVTNPSTDRAFDVSNTTINELAAILGTLITDMNELTKGDAGSIRVEVTGTSSLTDAQVRGTVITNYGMAAGGDTTLSAYVGSTLCTIVVEVAGQAWSLKPPPGEAFTLDGVALTADYEVDMGQVAGDKISVIRRRTGAATYVWDLHTIQGTHTDGGAS